VELGAQALRCGAIDRLLHKHVPEAKHAVSAGSDESALGERGAVVGKEFTASDVVALIDAEAAPTADTHLRTLAERGFVRTRGDGMFGFRHVLVQEAVYRSAPKRLRAELHERYADRLEAESPDLPDLDEFVGYHLEQAYRLRTELGEADRRTEGLAVDAGQRLGAAGVRASKRADIGASVSLLGRAAALPLSSRLESELLCELGIALRGAGNLERAVSVLERAAELAMSSDDALIEARARMELEYVSLTFEPRVGDQLLDAASRAIPLFEAAGDDRLLGRALLLVGWVHGGHRGQNALRLDAAERALECYQRSTWPAATPAGEIANALYFGPTPVSIGISRCETLLRAARLDRFGQANVESFLGGLVAQAGDGERAHSLVASAAVLYQDLGQRTSAATFSGAIAADVFLLSGDAEAAVEQLRAVCRELESAHAFSALASSAGALAGALYLVGAVEEALEWTNLAEHHAAADDMDAHVLWMPVRAKVLARKGAFAEAVAVGARAIELAETTDALNRHAQALRDLGEVFSMAGISGEASAAYRRAHEFYTRKGNVVEAERVRLLVDDPALV
jgi:tetratricopeptide (TPR) repeat protein